MDKACPMSLAPAELIDYTPLWDGPRDAAGRPMVSDDLLDRMARVTITEAWAVLRNEGFHWQYAGGFACTHPGQTLVGRALTAMYMPRRPDMRAVMEQKGSALGHVGDQISWPIDCLIPRDVYVADVYGKIEEGPVIGDNLATAIFRRSGNGVVHDAAVRDIDGIQDIPGFTSFVRGFHPTYASPTIMLCAMNAPTRIGPVTVMPGDIVLGRDSGVIFIPPHLARKVVETSELVRLRDAFGKERLSQGTYLPGQIDARWTEGIEADFALWVKDHEDELPALWEQYRHLLEQRTW